MSTPKPLSGKVALVTGGSKGISRAISLQLASLGATVVVSYSSDSAPAEEVVSQIVSSDSHALAIKADVSSLPSIDSLISETVSKFGEIDILIACAAIMTNAVLSGVKEEDYDRTFTLNVKGPLFLVQKSVSHMAAGSRIVLFSTNLANASTLTPNYLTYVMSRGAIEQMTRSLSKDLSPKGITVNCVPPGPTGTELLFMGKSEGLLKTIAGFSPMNRIGIPEENSEVVCFLASLASSWVTGQLVKVNRGMS